MRDTSSRRVAQTKTSNSLIWESFKKYFTLSYFILDSSSAHKSGLLAWFSVLLVKCIKIPSLGIIKASRYLLHSI